MQNNINPISKKKTALVWCCMAGMFISMVILVCWLKRGSVAPGEPVPRLANIIASIFIGWVFVVTGVVGYLIVLFTTCFTFAFDRPVWKSHKRKVYCANIFVPLLPALGLGIALQPFLSPMLQSHGMDPAIANLLPVMLVIGALQFLQLKLLIWAPLEARFITKRLLAQGVTMEQLRSGTMVGLSNPLRTSFGKGIIEDDMGVLWISSDQLVFWGDIERFSITRAQLSRLEQKGDVLNATALSGISHVVLHVKTVEGLERSIRLHVEGAWTMAQKGRGMNSMADQIAKWHSATAAPAQIDTAAI